MYSDWGKMFHSDATAHRFGELLVCKNTEAVPVSDSIAYARCILFYLCARYCRYLPDDGFHNTTAAKQFDKIDMVFIGTVTISAAHSPVFSSHMQLHIPFLYPSLHAWLDRSFFCIIYHPDGDDNMLPWDPRLEQIRVLLKMCVLTNKCIFACTFASHMLIYMYTTVRTPDLPSQLHCFLRHFNVHLLLCVVTCGTDIALAG